MRTFATDEEIRREILAAADELTAASAALSEVLGRQAAYRSTRHLYGRVALSEGFEQFAPARTAPWHTPQETEYWKRLRSDDLSIEHETYARARERLFNPEFEAGIARLKGGDPSGTEYAIAYIEGDPWHFHSGYLKQKFARYLRRVHLTEPYRERLRIAILSAFSKGRREDLREYVSLARTLDTPQFRDALSRLSNGADEGTTERAARALAACLMNDLPGQDLRGGA